MRTAMSIPPQAPLDDRCMPATMPADLQVIWEQLRRRNDWALVDDQDAFLAEAAAEAQLLTGPLGPAARARLAIQRAYGARLYQGLRIRQDRAAYELWLAVVRITRARGWERARAEEVAQETLVRVLAQLGTLRSPQSLLPWALLVANTVRHELSRRTVQAAGPELADDDALVDPLELAGAVEDQITRQAIVQLLHGALPNELERRVLLAWVLEGLPPRDIARKLGLPPYQARLAKYRALQRVRGDALVRRSLQALVYA